MRLPAVRIDGDAWGDPRFPYLAKLTGLADGHHALVKVAQIWAWQTEHYTPEDPCFVVPAEVIDLFLGDGHAASLVKSQLASLVAGGYRIHGASHERTGWLYRLRQRSARGGAANQARHRKQAHKKEPGGSPRAQPEGFPQESTLSSLFSVPESSKSNTVQTAPSGHAPAEGPAPRPDPEPKPAPEAGGDKVACAVSPPWALSHPEPSAGSGSPSPESQAKPGPRPKAPPAPGHQEVIAAFWAGFEQYYGCKPTYTADMGAHVKRLLGSHPPDEITRRIGNFFARAPDWPKERDFGTFVRFFDKWTFGSVPHAPPPMPRRSKAL